jgi:Short C-terminal domain
MSQTEVGAGTGVFSVRTGAILGGIATTVGYLLLIIWTAVNHDRVSGPGPIIATGVFGCILGLAVLGVHGWLANNGRLIAVGAIGLVLLLLKMIASARLEFLETAAIPFGNGNAALGLGFVLAVFTIGCLVVRRESPENNAVRNALLGIGITGTLLYVVTILAALADGGRTSRGLGAAFGSGDIALIIFTSLVLLGLAGVLVIGLMAGTKHEAVKAICKWGIALGVLVFYLTVGYIFLDFFIGLMKFPERAAQLILILLMTLVTGIGTLFGPAFICVVSVGRIVGLSSQWQLWGGAQRLAAEKPFTEATSEPTPALPSPRFQPSPAVAATSTNVESQLKTLKDLHDKGLISQQEYVEKRAEILRRL